MDTDGQGYGLSRQIVVLNRSSIIVYYIGLFGYNSGNLPVMDWICCPVEVSTACSSCRICCSWFHRALPASRTRTKTAPAAKMTRGRFRLLRACWAARYFSAMASTAASSRSVSSWAGDSVSGAVARVCGLRRVFAGRFRRFSGGFHPQQHPHGDTEQAAHGDELFQLRHGGVGFPPAYCLPGHTQPLPQGLLAEPGGFSERLDAAAQGLCFFHGDTSFSAPSIPEWRSDRYHRRVSPLSTGSCGALFISIAQRFGEKKCCKKGASAAYGRGT